MQTILVTGTSGTLGSEIAKSLLLASYRVIGVSRGPNNDTLVSGHENYHEIPFDLAKIESIPNLVKSVVSQFGVIHGLVNNSALGAESVLATMHSRDIQDTLTVNLQAPIELTKQVIRGMLIEKFGRVVNITSVVAHTGYKGLSVYASTKSGLEGFTKSLAREVGKRGITVNNVAPGFMVTKMTSELGGDSLEQIKRRTPIGRLVSTEEVALAVKFLLAPESSGITGITLTVDGGASC